jgi:hypothetical protein
VFPASKKMIACAALATQAGLLLVGKERLHVINEGTGKGGWKLGS